MNNGPFAGRDANINVFVGGDFNVTGSAAEAEGKVVTLGNFSQNKAAGVSAVYNVGIAGVGSRVPPPDGSDFLTTGGNVTVAQGQRLIAEGGVVRHAGTVSGTVEGTVVQDAQAVAAYTPLRSQLQAASECYAGTGTPRPATGTAVNQSFQTLFTGDGTSALQVFNVDFDLTTSGGAQQGIVFQNIPANATVLVNLTGAARTVSTFSGGIDDTDPLNQLRERLLWNVPTAGSVTFTGTGQFQGSILVGNPASTTTVNMPGLNGRFFSTGTLDHTSGGSGGTGTEIHAYPFNGDLPTCGTPIPTASTSVTKVDAASNAPLAGAVFQLWRESNGVPGLQATGANPDTAVGSPCTTPVSGQCSAAGLPLGTYYWQETAAPPGYDLPVQDVSTVVLGTDGQDVPVTVQDTKSPVPLGSTTVTKVDAASNAPLAGAVFQLWRESNGVPGLQTTGADPDTAVGDPCVTSDAGVCTTNNLPLGTYYWQETAAPPGYDLPVQDVSTVVLGTDGQDVPVTVQDTKSPVPLGSTTVTKVDAASNAPLAGAVFQLWRESNGVPGLQATGANPDTVVGSPCTTPVSGQCSAAGLPLGTYYWQETAAPPGYDLPAQRVATVVLGTDGQDVPVTVRDSRTPDATGSTGVTKLDAGTGRPLAGAVFQLWRETNGVPGLQATGADADTAVGPPCTTPATGGCRAAGLPLGTYYWQEVSAPDGYDLPAEPVTTAVIAAAGQNVPVVVKDARTPEKGSGATKVTKVDAETGEPLAGAVFQLWRETNGHPGLQTLGANADTKVGEPCTTGDDGVCAAQDLPLGTYYWQEVSAPDGYALPADPVTEVVLTKDCPCVEVAVKDTRLCPPKPCPPKPCPPKGDHGPNKPWDRPRES
ncbi:SpaA isopeptide-forming pilin-related protein [Kitasatospora cineracea]|uniref:SpaA isopeptide-forming pilin-related protein n=1 Tax=Kitasatospora cineracea TaxID=88074 RepID=UPI0034046E81